MTNNVFFQINSTLIVQIFIIGFSAGYLLAAWNYFRPFKQLVKDITGRQNNE